MMKHFMSGEKPREWDKKLQFMLWSYREVPNSTTGLSPYQLVYGRAGRGPMSILQDTWAGRDSNQGVVRQRTKAEDVKYFQQLKEDLKIGANLASKHAEVAS